VYVDVAGWHLYLRDMTAAPGLKMHTALAQQFGPQVISCACMHWYANVEDARRNHPPQSSTFNALWWHWVP
jgi:hypothetical protein